MKEKISNLMDSELSLLDQRQLLEALKSDPESVLLWERYHTAATYMRASVSGEKTMMPINFADKVKAAINQEPTCLAPAAAKLNERQLSKATTSSRRWVSGLALAASVAAVTIAGNQLQWFQPNTPSSVAPLLADKSTRWDVETPELESELNSYLVEHGEFMPPSGLNGLMAYAKFVSYDAQQ